jgi:hypothetical protein
MLDHRERVEEVLAENDRILATLQWPETVHKRQRLPPRFRNRRAGEERQESFVRAVEQGRLDAAQAIGVVAELKEIDGPKSTLNGGAQILPSTRQMSAIESTTEHPHACSMSAIRYQRPNKRATNGLSLLAICRTRPATSSSGWVSFAIGLPRTKNFS